MDLASAVLPWLCCAISLATAWLIPLHLAHPKRLRALQLSLNAAPRTNLLLGVFLGISAVVSALLGIGFFLAGYSSGWGFFPLSVAQLILVGFFIYVARLPFPDLEAEANEPDD